MTHRVQVLEDEEEYAALQAAARRRRMTVSEYVRQTLREARDDQPPSPIEQKLRVVREAAEHAYPVGTPEEIKSETGTPRAGAGCSSSGAGTAGVISAAPPR